MVVFGLLCPDVPEDDHGQHHAQGDARHNYALEHGVNTFFDHGLFGVFLYKFLNTAGKIAATVTTFN